MSNSAVVWFLSCLMSDRYSSLACQWLELFSKLLAKALHTHHLCSLPPGPSRLSITLKPPCHHKREYGSPWPPWECQQSQSTAPTSPCRRPMQLACLLHSNPSWGSCLVVCGSPSCLPPCRSVVFVLRKYFTLEGCCGSTSEYFSLGGCGGSEMTRLPTDRLMALMRWRLVHSWEGLYCSSL